MLLTELVLAMVPTSVGDERIFSTMKYMRNPKRNSLKQEHLTACARGFKSKFCVGSFPYQGRGGGHWGVVRCVQSAWAL